jgi:hypothetical protein
MDRLSDAQLASAVDRVTRIARELAQVDPPAASLLVDRAELASEVLAARGGVSG